MITHAPALCVLKGLEPTLGLGDMSELVRAGLVAFPDSTPTVSDLATAYLFGVRDIADFDLFKAAVQLQVSGAKHRRRFGFKFRPVSLDDFAARYCEVFKTASLSETLQAALHMSENIVTSVEAIALHDRGHWDVAARVVFDECSTALNREAGILDYGPFEALQARASDRERKQWDAVSFRHAGRMNAAAFDGQPDWHNYRMRGPVLFRVAESA